MAGKLPFEFHPEAVASFFQEITTAVARIRDAPNTWPEYKGGTRRFLVHRFPFAVIYSQRSNSLIVLAVMHLRRRPGYWQDRIGSSED